MSKANDLGRCSMVTACGTIFCMSLMSTCPVLPLSGKHSPALFPGDSRSCKKPQRVASVPDQTLQGPAAEGCKRHMPGLTRCRLSRCVKYSTQSGLMMSTRGLARSSSSSYWCFPSCASHMDGTGPPLSIGYCNSDCSRKSHSTSTELLGLVHCPQWAQHGSFMKYDLRAHSIPWLIRGHF